MIRFLCTSQMRLELPRSSYSLAPTTKSSGGHERPVQGCCAGKHHVIPAISSNVPLDNHASISRQNRWPKKLKSYWPMSGSSIWSPNHFYQEEINEQSHRR